MVTLKRLLALYIAIGLTGCVSARATMLTPNRYEPVPESEVRVYLQGNEVPAECERVALIHAEGDVDLTNEGQMINAAKRRAGKVGANAIVLNGVRDPGVGTRVAAEVFGLPAERKGQMIAFRCAGTSHEEASAAPVAAALK